MQTEISSLYYEMNCVCITMDEWYRLMKGERKCSYRQLISRRKSCRPCVMNLPFNFTILSGGECLQTNLVRTDLHGNVWFMNIR